MFAAFAMRYKCWYDPVAITETWFQSDQNWKQISPEDLTLWKGRQKEVRSDPALIREVISAVA